MRQWPEDETVWLNENDARRPSSARQILSAVASLRSRGQYVVCLEGRGKIIKGPVSALTLCDAEAEIQFVFRLTPLGYGDDF